MPKSNDTFDLRLHTIANDLRAVAFALAGAGALLLCIAAFGTGGVGRGLLPLMITATAALILIGPGVWFAIASALLKTGNGRSIVKWSIRVAIGQVVGFVLALLVGLSNTRLLGPMAAPGFVMLFFVPAQAVLMIRLIQARGVINARDAARGFVLNHQAAEIAKPPVAQATEGEVEPGAYAVEVDDD